MGKQWDTLLQSPHEAGDSSHLLPVRLSSASPWNTSQMHVFLFHMNLKILTRSYHFIAKRLHLWNGLIIKCHKRLSHTSLPQMCSSQATGLNSSICAMKTFFIYVDCMLYYTFRREQVWEVSYQFSGMTWNLSARAILSRLSQSI